jgi:hypothetical protein
MVSLSRSCILARTGGQKSTQKEAARIRSETACREIFHQCLAPQYFIPKTEASPACGGAKRQN